MHRSSTIYKSKQSSAFLYKYVCIDFDVTGQQRMDFFTEGSVIMNYRLVFWPEVMV